jgi:pyruvate,water dikinase
MASAKAAWLLPLTSELAALPLVGGKGENLARLARAGFPVPGGYILTTQAYRAFVALNNLAAAIQNALPAGAPTPTACEEAASQIRARFCRGLLPDEWAAQIIAAYADLGRPPVAVR